VELYYQFINNLSLNINLKEKIILKIKKNGMCDEWRISFINTVNIILNN